MNIHRGILRISPCLLLLGLLCAEQEAFPEATRRSEVSDDFLDQVLTKEDEIRITLPNGRQLIGKVRNLRHSEGKIVEMSGLIQHPENGAFSFAKDSQGHPQGGLSFDASAVEWKISRNPANQVLQLTEVPAEDAFRPRRPEMPRSGDVPPGPAMSREQAEASLRKDLKFERLSDTLLKIGVVELDQSTRSIRFPGTANMHDGTVEYAVVNETGKRHEALFSTPATPRDIHLAMLLLGVKPTTCVETPEKNLKVPAGSAVELRAEWKTADSLENRAVRDLVTVARSSSQMREKPVASTSSWLYNGSRFNTAGFAASVEGSIASLIADDLALINNAASDRADDEIHIPDQAVMPKTDTPVTLIILISSSKPTSSPIP